MARTKDPELERERRLLIADATLDLLAEADWRGVTLSAVARRAGVSKGVVSYWFGSKETLLLAAIERFHTRYEARLLEALSDDLSARERFARLLEVAFPDQATVAWELRFQVELHSYAKAHPEVASQLEDSYARFRSACSALLHIGAAEGYVTASLDTFDDLYPMIHALIDGLSFQIAYNPDADVSALRDALLHHIEAWIAPTA